MSIVKSNKWLIALTVLLCSVAGNAQETTGTATPPATTKPEPIKMLGKPRVSLEESKKMQTALGKWKSADAATATAAVHAAAEVNVAFFFADRQDRELDRDILFRVYPLHPALITSRTPKVADGYAGWAFDSLTGVLSDPAFDRNGITASETLMSRAKLEYDLAHLGPNEFLLLKQSPPGYSPFISFTDMPKGDPNNSGHVFARSVAILSRESVYQARDGYHVRFIDTGNVGPDGSLGHTDLPWNTFVIRATAAHEDALLPGIRVIRVTLRPITLPAAHSDPGEPGTPPAHTP